MCCFFNRGDVRTGECVKRDKLWGPLRKIKEKSTNDDIKTVSFLKGYGSSLSCPVDSPKWSVCALEQGFLPFKAHHNQLVLG